MNNRVNNRWCLLTIIKLTSRNIHDFTKVLSRNNYLFWNRIQELMKVSSYTVSSYTGWCQLSKLDSYHQLVSAWVGVNNYSILNIITMLCEMIMSLVVHDYRDHQIILGRSLKELSIMRA